MFEEQVLELLNKQLEEFKSKQCQECKFKAEFRLDRLHDTVSGEALVLASGPSVLDDKDNLHPKAVENLKRFNGVDRKSTRLNSSH